jgi:hypothetical protein
MDVNTDVAQEINITARRNDTFLLELAILNPLTGNSYDLSADQGGNSPFPNGAQHLRRFQAKLTIKKEGSNQEILNLHSYHWVDARGNNNLPTPVVAGNYWGTNNEEENPQEAGIYMADSNGGADEVIYIRIPHDYMIMEPGEYVYDLQIREKENWYGWIVDTKSIYATWVKGAFNIVDDITQR